MAIAYLGLGSNLDNTRSNIVQAIRLLTACNIEVIEVAPFYYNPALLLPNAPHEFNKPFCNTVAKIFTNLTPQELLKTIKSIENQMSRDDSIKWSPRIIDIDILLYDNISLTEEKLTIPHPDLTKRNFCLIPLSYIAPTLTLNGVSVLELAKNISLRTPVLMGIINLTNDSFSEDGLLSAPLAIERNVQQWIEDGICLIDFGPQSTKPTSTPISAEEEIERLKAIMPTIKPYMQHAGVRFSIDSYYYETVRYAVENGFKIINDVSGITDERMLDLFTDNDIEMVAMYNLGMPARNQLLPPKTNLINVVNEFALQKIEQFDKRNIPHSKLIIDPGIGFVETAHQTIQLLRHVSSLCHLPTRILIGHSRKSFISLINPGIEAKDRDIETLGISLQLKNKGVDILRVHNPLMHKRALLASIHIE